MTGGPIQAALAAAWRDLRARPVVPLMVAAVWVLQRFDQFVLVWLWRPLLGDTNPVSVRLVEPFKGRRALGFDYLNFWVEMAATTVEPMWDRLLANQSFVPALLTIVLAIVGLWRCRRGRGQPGRADSRGLPLLLWLGGALAAAFATWVAVAVRITGIPEPIMLYASLSYVAVFLLLPPTHGALLLRWMLPQGDRPTPALWRISVATGVAAVLLAIPHYVGYIRFPSIGGLSRVLPIVATVPAGLAASIALATPFRPGGWRHLMRTPGPAVVLWLAAASIQAALLVPEQMLPSPVEWTSGVVGFGPSGNLLAGGPGSLGIDLASLALRSACDALRGTVALLALLTMIRLGESAANPAGEPVN